MLTVIATGETLGATIDELDLSQPLSQLEFQQVLTALGQHGDPREPSGLSDASYYRQKSAVWSCCGICLVRCTALWPIIARMNTA
jgi:hypothetical protein